MVFRKVNNWIKNRKEAKRKDNIDKTICILDKTKKYYPSQQKVLKSPSSIRDNHHHHHHQKTLKMITPATPTTPVEISNSKYRSSNTIDSSAMSRTNETATTKLEHYRNKKRKKKLKKRKKHMPPTLEVSFTMDDTASFPSLGTLSGSSSSDDNYSSSSFTSTSSSSSSSDDSDYTSSSSEVEVDSENDNSDSFRFLMNSSNNNIGDGSNNNNSNSSNSMNDKKMKMIDNQFNNDYDATSSSSSSSSLSTVFEPSLSSSQFYHYYSHFDPITERMTIRRRIDSTLDEVTEDQEEGWVSFLFLDSAGRQDMYLNNFLCDMRDYFVGVKPSLLSRSTNNNNEEKKSFTKKYSGSVYMID